DRQRQAGRMGIFAQLADAVADHFARAGQILRHDLSIAILRQPADHEHETRRTEFERFVDGALVVIERGAASGTVSGWKHSATTIARQTQARVANTLRRFLEARCRDLVAPRGDEADAAVRTSGDDL